MKSFFMTLSKMLLTAGLLFWLWDSGKLDFKVLENVWSNPGFILLTLGSWLVVQILGSVRWWILVNGSGYNQNFIRILQLHLTGLFFNTAMPGAVGGDLVKAAYTYLDEPQHGKTHAMISILIDRIVGLLGLFTLCGFVILVNSSLVFSSSSLVTMSLPVALLSIFSILFLTLAINGAERVWGIKQWMERGYLGHVILRKIFNSFSKYRECKGRLVLAWALSVGVQGMAMVYFWLVAVSMLGIDVAFTLLAIVFPIGVLITVIPLAPGGLGVGHVAFENLFQMIGVNSGATVFNIYILSFLFFNLFGGIAYLFLKRRKGSVSQLQEHQREYGDLQAG